MKSWFIIPLILIIVAVAGYVLYGNQALLTQVKNVVPQTAEQAADQPKDTVIIRGFAFSPKTITVRAGDSVTWTNQDAITHTATSDDGLWDTGLIAQGESKTITFATPGTFSYHCTPHPSMTAIIIVQ